MTLVSSSLVVAACVIAALFGLAAALATPEHDRRTWLAIAAALGLFAAYKHFALQAAAVGQVEAVAHAGGWYGARRLPQGIVMALMTLATAIGAWRLLRRGGQRSPATRVGLAAAIMLTLYALLGLVSLHQWDHLISLPLGSTPLYAFVELVLALVAALCALVAIAAPRADGAPDQGSRTRQALIAFYLLGWMLLPVAVFVASYDQMDTLGTALPSATLLTKAALLPAALVLVSLLAGGALWRRWRPHVLDLAIASFCALPLLHGRPFDAFYLAAAWLATWLLGRVLLAGTAGRRDALAMIAAAGLVLIPIALLEGATPAWLYTAIYGPHPFQTTGVERYIGFRPVGFFEDGNQYGIWTAMAVLAAIELARTNRGWRWIAAALTFVALAAQSAGAVALLLGGALLLVIRPRLPYWVLPASVAVLVLGAAVYISGVVPLEHIARDTWPGQLALGAFRKIGRGSLPWRISQDQRALPLIAQHLWLGHGAWDWWKPLGRRPWGLPMLIVGQYGVFGLMLLIAALLAGALRTIARGVRDERFALAVIVLLAGIDAVFNSTIYFPAVLLAGALAGPTRRGARP